MRDLVTIMAGFVALGAGGVASAQEVPRLEPAFTILAEIGEAIELGPTASGDRRVIPITGGTVTGETVRGTVRAGAWDWQLDRADGCTEVEADYFLETEDRALINVVNTATICPPAEGEAPEPVFTRPVFEAPLGRYQWLNQAMFVGRLELARDHAVPAVRITIYRLR